jgi:3-hydroxyisobutyrate dehydrogenase-like beta-hydroxyacid dehydrogenase
MNTIALLHPGAMGASVGSALTELGHDVTWASGGRSQVTADRARSAGLRGCSSLDEALSEASHVMAVLPPESAKQCLQAVLREGFTGTYVDLNAVAPGTAMSLHDDVVAAGGMYVDGGIVGPPAWGRGTTRLALSGSTAPEVASLFQGSNFEPILLESGPVAASAFKMAFAGWTKGTSALVLALRAFAAVEGVEEALISEWSRRGMDLAERAESARLGAVPKAWRFAGEMDEIGSALAAVGLPKGFFEAAADLYQRLEPFKDRFEDPPDLRAVIETLTEGGAHSERSAGPDSGSGE